MYKATRILATDLPAWEKLWCMICKAHRHADVADTGVQQQRGQVRGRLPRSGASACSHHRWLCAVVLADRCAAIAGLGRQEFLRVAQRLGLTAAVGTAA